MPKVPQRGLSWDLIEPTSLRSLRADRHCLAQWRATFAAGGPIKGEMFGFFFFFKKFYLLSPLYQGSVVALTVLNYPFTLSSSLKEHFKS